MRKVLIITTSCIIIPLFLVGGCASNYSTSHEEYSDEMLHTYETQLLNNAKNQLALDLDSYYISNLEDVDSILKEIYSTEDYEKVSNIIYSEYYNKNIERKPNTLILIEKNLDTVGIISEDSSGKITSAEYNLNSTSEKQWIYQ
ncbi:hypothetical protein [Lysinibacillus sp. RC79]|uniref:hypothetical protein n=1 Tax=Lysinibacillus sp. RC79 TaxID=3156296 RepID=UPI003517A309